MSNNPQSMTFNDLRDALGIQNGALSGNTVTIDQGVFTSNIDTLMEYNWGGQNIYIRDAVLKEENQTEESVTISGNSHFLNAPDLQVVLTAWTDQETGLAEMKFDFQVLEATPSPTIWKLSDSIPGIAVEDPSQSITFDRATGEVTTPTYFPLDELKFFETRFVVTSIAGVVDDTSGRSLQWGTNFLSKVKAEGPVAMVSSIMGHSEDFDVSGTIRIPAPSETTSILTTPYENALHAAPFAWDVKDDFQYNLPGVHLQIHLGFNYDLVANKIGFRADTIDLYTPYRADWAVPTTTPQFLPQQAFRGSVSLGSANMQMDFAADFDFGVDYLTLISRFEGISLGNLAELTDLTGSGESLMDHLPTQISDLGSAIGTLSLTNMTIEFDARNASEIYIPRIAMTVGMPDINWDVWPGHFSIDSIAVNWDIKFPFISLGSLDDPDQQRSLTTYVQGEFTVENVPFRVRASSGDNYTVFAEMQSGATINLSDVINSFDNSVEVPAGLTIDLFRVGVSPGESYNLALGMVDGGWDLKLGGQDFSVSDVYLNMHKTTGQPVTASIGGDLALGSLGTFSIDYESPGDVVIYSYFPEIKVMDLIEEILPGKLSLPSGFDFDLEDSSILIKKEGQDYSFQLATEINTVGSMALQIDKTTGQWGAAFGIDLYLDKLSDLPGCGVLSALDGRGAPDQLLLVVSSIDRPNFQFPALAEFNNPALNANAIPTPPGGGLTDGLNLYASWRFGNGDQGTNTLLNLLQINGNLDVAISIPTDPRNGTKLFLSYGGQVLDNYDLNAQFGLRLNNGIPELFLGGTMTVPIKGNDCIFDVAMSAMATGIYFSGSMAGTLDFDGFQLSNLGLVFGINWALIPSIGVMATINTAQFNSSIAVLFNANVPSQSVMAGSISDISLKGVANEIAKVGSIPNEITDVLETISIEGINEFAVGGGVMRYLDEKDHAEVAKRLNEAGSLNLPSDSENLLIVVSDPGRKWTVTDISDGMKHYEVEQFSDGVKCKANAQIYLAPQAITIGGFNFVQGFRVMGALSILGLTWTTDIEISEREGIAATSYLDDSLVIWSENFFKLSDSTGSKGPLFSMATFSRPENQVEELREPHFILDGKLNLLGTETTAMVKFNTSKFEFLVGQSQSMSNHVGAFSGSYNLDWSINGTIGKNVGIDMGGDFDFAIAGTVNLKKLIGAEVKMGKVSIDMEVSASVDAAYDGKNGHLRVTGSFEFMGTNHSISFNLNGSTRGIDKIGEKVLDKVMKEIKNFYDNFDNWFDQLGGALEDLGDEIAAAAEVLGKHFDKSAEFVADKLKGLGADANRIASELTSNLLVATDRELAAVLDGLGYGASVIANAIKNAWTTTASNVADALKHVGADVKQIGNALKSAFNSSISSASGIIKNLGFNPVSVCTMIKNVFPNASLQTVTNVLKGLGYDTHIVLNRLKHHFNKGIQDSVNLLKNAGYSAREIGTGLESAFNRTANSIAGYLENAGFSAQLTGEVIYHQFRGVVNSEEAGEIMKYAGYSAREIAKVLRKDALWDKGSKATGKILKKAEFGKSTVKDALRYAGWSTSTVNDVINSIF